MKRTRYPFALRNRRRAGLSLTEVLIATFVMAIGLLSLASLIPVGLHEVAMASRAQHASAVGRAAWREIKIRGWLRPYGPPWPAGVPTPNRAIWFAQNGTPTGLPSTWPAPAYQFSAFAIDPFFLSAYSNNGASGSFPINDADSAPVLPRITLRASEYDPGPLLVSNNSYLYARRLFMHQDDPVFDTFEGAPRPDRVGLLNGYPEVEGHYSWMMTVSPSLGDTNRLSTVAVVVFYKRVVENPSGGNALPDPTQERTARVTFPSAGTHIGGGDVQLDWSGTPDAFPKLRPGNWLMLFGRIQGNGPIFARWYRIVATGEFDGSVSTRLLTIQGYDWPAQQFIPTTYAAVFDGVVGVYEKTVQLE